MRQKDNLRGGSLYEKSHSFVGNVLDVDVAVGDDTDVDANGDSKVNNRDLALLQQHLNGWTVTICEDVCDVNGDGEVNNKDLALLQQYLNDWDVVLK